MLAIMLISVLSCKKSTTDNFSNKLTFGTSVNYNDFTLVGEGTTFSTTPGNVVFRLESSEDFNGNPVRFVIKGPVNSTETFTNNPKPTGHIFITSFSYALKGSYSVTGYIVKTGGDQLVASASFQMN
jgi:hypothetical protein